jgi:hypothetical protein
MHLWGAIKGVCEQVIRDAHDTRFTTIKSREAYVLSVKTEHSGLANRNIRFRKLAHPVFPDRPY